MTEENGVETKGTPSREQVQKIQMEKAKKNLVYVGIMSVVMLFGSLCSAYIVSMGDTFWLKFPMPMAFWTSTALILLSSVTMIMAVQFVKKANYQGLKLMMALTMALGLAFIYFQFKGYGQLVDRGVYAVSNHILVTDGKYGDYFEVKYKGDFIEVNGNDFLLKGKSMSDNEFKAFQSYMAQFLELKDSSSFVVQPNKDFMLYLNNTPLTIQNNELFKNDSLPLEFLDNARLRDLAVNIRDKRGDFFIKGEIGKDFQIYFKGEELQYKDRQLYKDGKILSNYLQIKALETPDTASSYLYIITFLHLLHIVVTLLVMIRPLIFSFTGRINVDNNIGLRTAAIFWHFLGLLWVYLLLFLLFIH